MRDEDHVTLDAHARRMLAHHHDRLEELEARLQAAEENLRAMVRTMSHLTDAVQTTARLQAARQAHRQGG